jgi:hypothetical protein
MDLHDANGARFCRYHVGDWYGLWTPYTVDGVTRAVALSPELPAHRRRARHHPAASLPLCGWPAGDPHR